MSENISDKEKKTNNKVIDFLNKKGFYIVLFLCICVVGVTAALITRSNMEYYSYKESEDNYEDIIESEEEESADEDVPVIAEFDDEETNDKDESSDITEHDKDITKDIVIVESKPDVQASALLNEAKAQEGSGSPKNEENAKEEFLPIYPVEGELILEFAKDKLIYLNTLERWGTHNGIDINADLGTPVKAAADGTIEKIYEDKGYGITIVINHNNGYKTVYSNLSIDNMVKENQTVKQGEIISGVGDTAIFETEELPHLHFEIIKDDKHVNPRKYLPN